MRSRWGLRATATTTASKLRYRAYSRRAGPSPAYYQPTHPIHRRTNGRMPAPRRPAVLMMGSFNAAGGIGRCPATVRSAVHGHGQ